ncbi:putative phage protein [Melissococcus plutonius]|uniref:siphovirus Gp157 family protein n=1 Tax=Melissococcus plutonius TaxID=33970 RepID=UPI00065E15A1|nr:siphovirus Gp157 family protein [Melissococcus plutonius]AIM25773.1 putative phage protein [Melissococcus plutonius S1]KMT23469.1 putative phage protein [Melissococcus plutonius]KMT25227.1 putative phage protein [Melissococcus plutonius]KMT26133.1 putative phage protein [Melissococcus plutonius]KMT26863.1 putative phage protein [Melissococcus plutonius]
MATLYELTDKFKQVEELLAEDEYNPTIVDTLESLDLALADKAEGYARIIKNQEADSKELADEIKRLQQRKQAIDSSITRLKQSLQYSMQKTGKTKFKTPLFSFGVQKNTPKVEITDESLIPVEFIKTKTEIDKKAIKEAGDVPGTEIVQTESLRIR